ncbi:hypothetical protein [Streptomyces gibsoniae]|uniref:hypothetical protein n=1 Tax=Streptomyces gibsoniae TaxID=3075529 RepID=UPI002889CDE3|nr:hypothetical protein [Streptomyces sp. DSM 41699]
MSDGTVPLTDVARTAACSYTSIDQAARKGLVEIARQGGHGNTRHITVGEALFLVAVAAVAAAATMNFCDMLRAVRQAGATMTAEGLIIPVKGLG